MGLSFTIAAGPHQRSHSQVRVPRDSWPHFTVSDSRLLQPGAPGSRVCIPQEQGGPVIPPGAGIPFRRLLWLAELRWRYSNPPPHVIFLTGSSQLSSLQPLCTDRVGYTVTNSNSIVEESCLPIRCLETGCITPLFIRLLHSNGCTHYNTVTKLVSSKPIRGQRDGGG
jgi:hypothetical protein